MTMEQKTPAPVKTRRRYDSSGRRERARQTRDQITDIAKEMFLAEGYGQLIAQVLTSTLLPAPGI